MNVYLRYTILLLLALDFRARSWPLEVWKGFRKCIFSREWDQLLPRKVFAESSIASVQFEMLSSLELDDSSIDAC